MIELDAIRRRLSVDGARRVVAERAAGTDVGAPSLVYYPYDWSQWTVSTPSIWGRRGVTASCLVDATSGRAATTDAFEVEGVDVGGADVIAPALGDEALLGSARTYVAHAARSAARILAAPRLELLKHQIIYRPFFVVPCAREGERFRVLVDGVTRRFHVLGAA